MRMFLPIFLLSLLMLSWQPFTLGAPVRSTCSSPQHSSASSGWCSSFFGTRSRANSPGLEYGECIYCSDEKDIVRLRCGHALCSDCINQVKALETPANVPVCCPTCTNIISAQISLEEALNSISNEVSQEVGGLTVGAGDAIVKAAQDELHAYSEGDAVPSSEVQMIISYARKVLVPFSFHLRSIVQDRIETMRTMTTTEKYELVENVIRTFLKRLPTNASPMQAQQVMNQVLVDVFE